MIYTRQLVFNVINLMSILYFHLSYDKTTGFPVILESIKIDKNHVKLQYKGNPLPLPHWFVQEHLMQKLIESISCIIYTVTSEILQKEMTLF